MKLINNILNKFSIPLSVIESYNEKHRYYHNIDHIMSMLNMAEVEGILTDELALAIIFHDIVYDPNSKDNEILSANLFYSYVKNDIIKQAIIDTRNHIPSNDLSKELCRLDLFGINDLSTFIEHEDLIFKEFQSFDYKDYYNDRIKFLENYNVNQNCIDFFKHKKRNIAVYAGSFNPFHKGHYNILTKAEAIFDKVIIARGISLNKVGNKQYNLPEIINNRQIETYSGLLTDFINNLGYDVTLIRGLRNASDLEFEKTQSSFLKDLKPDINIVYMTCDREYEHISSSAIRQLEFYKKEKPYLL